MQKVCDLRDDKPVMVPAQISRSKAISSSIILYVGTKAKDLNATFHFFSYVERGR